MNARPTRWILAALVAAALYLVIGVVTASLAGSASSLPGRNLWRYAAWVLCLLVFAGHLVRERVHRGFNAWSAALHAAVAVAIGGLALAAAGPVRTYWGTGTAGRALLALVTWPLLVGVPAFLVGLAGATILRSRATYARGAEP
jgi:drug/metabolite transporter (DMT)-like permease